MKKKIAAAILAVAVGLGLASCSAESDTASHNLSTASDNFEIDRRIVFFNGITDTYLLEIEGLCSIRADETDQQLEVTCKTDHNQYKKHFLGLSDNVSYFVEQIQGEYADPFHYRVMFRPETIVPNIDMETSN